MVWLNIGAVDGYPVGDVAREVACRGFHGSSDDLGRSERDRCVRGFEVVICSEGDDLVERCLNR